VHGKKVPNLALSDLFDTAKGKGLDIVATLRAQLSKTKDFQAQLGALAGRAIL
jgi:hypothetical protein